MNVYVRTNLIDPTDLNHAPINTGLAVPDEAVKRTLKALELAVAEVTGSAVRVATIEFGIGAKHENEPGWLVIEYFHRENTPQGYAGFGATDINGYGHVRLGVHDSAKIDCAPMPMGLAMHEIGHVFGLGHPTALDTPNMMTSGQGTSCTEAHFSPIERLHARIAYLRPRGNTDPDSDPLSYVLPGARP